MFKKLLNDPRTSLNVNKSVTVIYFIYAYQSSSLLTKNFLNELHIGRDWSKTIGDVTNHMEVD